MTRFARFLGALVLVLGSVGVSAEELELLPAVERDAFLSELEAKLGDVSSVEVRFRQERHLEIFDQPVVSAGVLAFVRPDRLHWEWVEPYPSVLVLNGGRIERFDVVDGAPRKMRAAGEEMLRSVAVQMTRWLQGRFRESSELFDLGVTAGAEPMVVLTTRSPGLAEMLSAVEVRLAGGATVTSVSLQSPSGETTVMEFSDERRNQDLDPALFDLVRPRLVGPPPGD